MSRIARRRRRGSISTSVRSASDAANEGSCRAERPSAQDREHRRRGRVVGCANRPAPSWAPTRRDARRPHDRRAQPPRPRTPRRDRGPSAPHARERRRYPTPRAPARRRGRPATRRATAGRAAASRPRLGHGRWPRPATGWPRTGTPRTVELAEQLGIVVAQLGSEQGGEQGVVAVAAERIGLEEDALPFERVEAGRGVGLARQQRRDIGCQPVDDARPLEELLHVVGLVCEHLGEEVVGDARLDLRAAPRQLMGVCTVRGCARDEPEARRPSLRSARAARASLAASRTPCASNRPRAPRARRSAGRPCGSRAPVRRRAGVRCGSADRPSTAHDAQHRRCVLEQVRERGELGDARDVLRVVQHDGDAPVALLDLVSALRSPGMPSAPSWASRTARTSRSASRTTATTLSSTPGRRSSERHAVGPHALRSSSAHVTSVVLPVPAGAETSTIWCGAVVRTSSSRVRRTTPSGSRGTLDRVATSVTLVPSCSDFCFVPARPVDRFADRTERVRAERHPPG